MTATSVADYPSLGFDPTPGDIDEVSTLVTTLAGVANTMNEISNVLHGSADGDWRGKAAEAFRDLLDDDLRPKVDKARDGFGEAHRYISTWSTDLTSYQTRARVLENDATAAQDRATSAQANLNGLPAAPPADAPPPTDAAARQKLADQATSRTSGATAVTYAQGELDDVRTRAHDLEDEYRGTGADIAQRLAHSIDIAPNEPGWFDSMMDSIGDFFDSIGDLIADLGDIVLDFLHSIAPLLKLIGDIAGMLSTILGLLAFIPGLQFLALPALILGGVALMSHYLSAAGTSGSFLDALTNPDVIMDAVGLVMGIGAMKLGAKLTTVARAGGNTRMVPQLIGAGQEIPYGFFSIAKGMVPTMAMDEMVVRTISLHSTWAGFIMTGFGAPGGVSNVSTAFDPNFSPIDHSSPAVRS